MAQIPYMNWMGDQPTGSAYDVYQYYLGGGNPNATPGGGGGGGGTTGIMQAFPTGGRDGGFNPYNPDMSKVKTNYTPNYDYRQFSEYGLNPSTADIKQMDMNQSYFNKPSPSKLAQMSNFIPGVGALKKAGQFLGGILPVNPRAIFENELRGSGVYTDDIGRIVAGPGGYNTSEGIMAGYNAAQMTDKTFDKRTDTIANTLSNKYGVDISSLSEEDIENFDPTNPAFNLVNRHALINKAKINFRNKKKKAEDIFEFEKQKKEKKKKEKKQAQQLRDAKDAADRANIKKIQQHTGQALSDYRMDRPASERQFTGHGKSGMGRDPSDKMATGGMVKDLTKDPEYRGWKKMYESNPEVGSMHDKHPTFIKFYKQHERDKKKFGGLAGLLYG